MTRMTIYRIDIDIKFQLLNMCDCLFSTAEISPLAQFICLQAKVELLEHILHPQVAIGAIHSMDDADIEPVDDLGLAVELSLLGTRDAQQSLRLRANMESQLSKLQLLVGKQEARFNLIDKQSTEYQDARLQSNLRQLLTIITEIIYIHGQLFGNRLLRRGMLVHTHMFA
jgi:hypothetical protein